MAKWTAEDVKKLRSATWTADDVKRLREQSTPKIDTVKRDQATQAKRAKTLTNLSQGSKTPIDQLPPQQRDQATQARRATMGTTKNMTEDVVTKVTPKPTIGNTMVEGLNVVKKGVDDVVGFGKNIITDPLGTLDRIDQSQFGKDIAAGVGDSAQAYIGAVQSIGGDKVPLVKDALSYGMDSAKQTSSLGGTSIPSQVVRALPGAASNLALGMLSGGASVPAQLGKTAMQQEVSRIASSPAFYNSFLRSYGGAYNQSREEGADRPQAITRGALQAFPQALLEMAGGIENLPADAVKQGLFKTMGKAGAEELVEELLQYPFEGLSKKATYAPETPWFSTKEEAVINPIGMGENALVGGLVGGLFGGGTKIFSGDVQLPTNRQVNSDVETAVQPIIQAQQEAAPTANPIFYTDPYGNTSTDINKAPLLLPEAKQTVKPQMPTAEELAILNNPTIETDAEANFPKFDNLSINEINMLVSELKNDRQKILDEQVNWLKNSMGQGVEQGGIVRDMWGDVVDRYGRMSNNEYWYQEWAKNNNYRKPTKAELYEIAEKQLYEGVQTNDTFIPPNEEYIQTDEFIDYAESQLNSSQRKADIQDRLAQYEAEKQREFYTVPFSAKREAPFTAVRPTSNMAESVGETTVAPIGGKVEQDFTPIGGKVLQKNINIPLKSFDNPTIPKGKVESGVSANIRTDTNSPEGMRASYEQDPLSHTQKTNAETLSKAEQIMSEGYETARAKLDDMLDNMDTEAAPLAILLAREAWNRGDAAGSRQIVSHAANKAIKAGRFGQAFKILRSSDPASLLMSMQKQIKKLNADGLKKYGKKWVDVDLTDSEVDLIMNSPINSETEFEQLHQTIGQRIAKGLASTGMEKFDAWRRIAMLFNPKTHIRNLTGNVLMATMRKTSDTIGAGLEAIFVPEGQRTKSVGWSFNKDVKTLVNNNWETAKKDLLSVSRWDINSLKSLGMEKDIFKTKWLQGLNEASLKSLNWEDNIFTERAYKDALGQYLQANKMTEVTQEATEYATRRALESTFKQANKLATALNEWKQIKGTGKLVEAAVPFTKTPANIAKTAFEYSPVGFTKLLFQSDRSATAIIETLSKGLTGSAIVALGMWLNALGWAKAGKKSSKKAEAIESAAGIQQYSIKTKKGSFTLDWAQPFAIPFFMGVSLNEAIKGNDNMDYESIMDAVAKGGDTFFNMSMLQNIKNIMGGAGSSTEAILGLPWNYIQQAWPSIFGQSARTIDDTRRSTYDPSGVKQTFNTIVSKTPFASKMLEPAYDIWGEKQSTKGFIQQFINPGYWKDASTDPVTNEVARLYSSVNDTDMLPKVAPNNFTYDKKPYILTAEQKTEFARQMGQENYIDMRAIIHTDDYQNATDDKKAKMLKKIADKNYDEAKEMIVGN